MLLYRKAIELYPDDADFHVNLAVNYSTHRAEASKEFGWDLPRVFRECILSYQRARALDAEGPGDRLRSREPVRPREVLRRPEHRR